MATEEVYGTNAPNPSVNWSGVSPSQAEIQELGKFTAKVQTRYGMLTFNQVYQSWKMTLAENYGNLYLLHLKAVNTNGELNYEAIVWVQPEGHCGPEPRTLVSFKELPSEA